MHPLDTPIAIVGRYARLTATWQRWMMPAKPFTETGLPSQGDQDQNAELRALWEDLAVKARIVHCPQHYAEPWRVRVIGTPPRLKLDISGCCPKIGAAINDMIRNDPRISGPR